MTKKKKKKRWSSLGKQTNRECITLHDSAKPLSIWEVDKDDDKLKATSSISESHSHDQIWTKFGRFGKKKKKKKDAPYRGSSTMTS